MELGKRFGDDAFRWQAAVSYGHAIRVARSEASTAEQRREATEIAASMRRGLRCAARQPVLDANNAKDASDDLGCVGTLGAHSHSRSGLSRHANAALTSVSPRSELITPRAVTPDKSVGTVRTVRASDVTRGRADANSDESGIAPPPAAVGDTTSMRTTTGFGNAHFSADSRQASTSDTSDTSICFNPSDGVKHLRASLPSASPMDFDWSAEVSDDDTTVVTEDGNDGTNLKSNAPFDAPRPRRQFNPSQGKSTTRRNRSNNRGYRPIDSRRRRIGTNGGDDLHLALKHKASQEDYLLQGEINSVEQRAHRIRQRHRRRHRQRQDFSQSTPAANVGSEHVDSVGEASDHVDSVGATETAQPAADVGRDHVDSVGAADTEVHSAGDDTAEEAATVFTPEQFSQLTASIQALREETIASSRVIQGQMSEVIATNQQLRNENYHLSCQLFEARDVLCDQAQYTQRQVDLLLTHLMPEALARLPAYSAAPLRPRVPRPGKISKPPTLEDRMAMAWARDTSLPEEHNDMRGEAPVFYTAEQTERRDSAAGTVQCVFRGWSARRRYEASKAAAILIQTVARRCYAKGVIKRLRSLRRQRLAAAQASQQKIDNCAEEFATCAQGKSYGRPDKSIGQLPKRPLRKRKLSRRPRRHLLMDVPVALCPSGGRPSTVTVVDAEPTRSCPVPTFDLDTEDWPRLTSPSTFAPPVLGADSTSPTLDRSVAAIIPPYHVSIDCERSLKLRLAAVVTIQTAVRDWFTRAERLRLLAVKKENAQREARMAEEAFDSGETLSQKEPLTSRALKPRARKKMSKDLTYTKTKLQYDRDNLKACNNRLSMVPPEAEYLKLVEERRELVKRIPILEEECADFERKLGIEPERRVVKVDQWNIYTAPYGTKFVCGLVYGHARYVDGEIENIEPPSSINTDKLCRGDTFHKGIHTFVLGEEWKEELAD